jgi:hypothetical protein
VVGGHHFTGTQLVGVTPAQLSSATYVAGTGPGSDTIYAVVQQSDNTFPSFASFTVTTEPTVVVHDQTGVGPGQVISLSTLATVHDAGNIGYKDLELYDTAGTAAGGRFFVNGVAQGGNQVISLTSGELANTTFHVGTGGGTDTIYAWVLENDNTISTPQVLTITDPLDVGAGATVDLPWAYG